jgi:HAD superfamily hydrolase (TIGR01509 family)
MMGMSAPEWSHYIATKLGVNLPDREINEGIAAEVAARYRTELPLMPGAVETVRALAKRFPLGLASSSNRPLIELALDGAGLRDSFRVVVSADEVARGKPAPDVYLRAAELLKRRPQDCAAVEDSANGIRSARAAAMVVIAIPNHTFPPSSDALKLADRVLESITELCAEGVLEAAGSGRAELNERV